MRGFLRIIIFGPYTLNSGKCLFFGWKIVPEGRGGSVEGGGLLENERGPRPQNVWRCVPGDWQPVSARVHLVVHDRRDGGSLSSNGFSLVAAPNRGMSTQESQQDPPSLWAWVLKVSTWVGLTGMICCVAPAVLFAFGLMGGIYAISFANFFYAPDGSAALGAWVLRGLAVLVGGVGVYLYYRRQNQCSVDPARKRKNLVLATLLIAVLGTGLYVTFERATSWYFDEYIVPAQQAEYEQMENE